MNSCMFYVYKDDNKCMLEWNQEDTLYENKNIIYLILTWIGEVWGRKYEKPEGKVMHWLKQIGIFLYSSFFLAIVHGEKSVTQFWGLIYAFWMQGSRNHKRPHRDRLQQLK